MKTQDHESNWLLLGLGGAAALLAGAAISAGALIGWLVWRLP